MVDASVCVCNCASVHPVVLLSVILVNIMVILLNIIFILVHYELHLHHRNSGECSKWSGFTISRHRLFTFTAHVGSSVLQFYTASN